MKSLTKAELQMEIERLRKHIGEMETQADRNQRTHQNLRQIEWMLAGRGPERGDYVPDYGDLSLLNQGGLILTTVGRELLREIASDYLDLLETSAAIYERNGNYALGLFSSGWCQLMDSASRRLCGTDDNLEALQSRKWLCHESCWKDASLKSIETGEAVDIECSGGIHLYALPVWAGGEIVGSINFGYGDPPKDEKKLCELSRQYRLPLEDLREHAETYPSRPQFVIDYAKTRLEKAATYLGTIIEREQAAQAMRASEQQLRAANQQLAASNQQLRATEQQFRASNQQLEASNQQLRAAEEKLRESERHLRAIVLNTPDHIIMQDREQRYIFVVNHQLGLTDADMIGKTDRELPGITAEDAEKLTTIKRKVFETGEPFYLETPLKNLKGETEYFEGTYTPNFDSEGNVNGLIGYFHNITERKRAEEALRESEDRYRDLVEHSNDLFCTHDLEGKLLSVNPAAIRISGYSEDELLGMGFRDFLAPEVRDQFGKYLTEIRAKGVASGVMLVQTKGGEKRLWEYHNTLRTEGLAAPIVRGMARDITERKQAEDALRKSEERFRELYDNAPVGYFEYDTQGRITNVNRTELEMLGYTAEEMIGQPVWKFMVEEEIARQQILAKLAGTMPPARGLERNYKKKDGTVVPVLIEDRILRDPQGRITCIRCTIQDITDRKEADEALRRSEEKHRTILENIEEGYFEVDIAGNFTFFNDSMCRILGYSRDEMIGMNNRQYTDQENVKKLFQAFNQVYRTGEPAREFDWEIIRKDGTKRSIEASVSLIKDSSGNRIGFRGIVRDVTERKRIEQEKTTLAEQLRQSQKIEAIGQLSGGIAHDFNNILTIISGNAQLSLFDLKQGDPLRENIEEIRRASERAADLTRQLLAFSRKQMMEMKVLDLNLIVQGLDKMLHRLLGEDIDLVTVLPEGIGKVKADPGQIEQVIVNLAVNARDAMIEGGKLTIETADVELDEEYARKHIAVIPGRYVMLSVSDTGVGMSSEVKDRVFEPFFTTKEKGKGTGLGLSTIYGIVKQSSGNIWIYSEPGQGTTFKIYLPQVDEPLTEQKQEVVKEIPRGNETILVVEDEDTVRKLAIRLLKGQGYKVFEAPDGGKALLLCEKFKERIHLILTDVVMPGMSGRKLAERLKQIRPEMKVLYMSGYTDNSILHHGILEPGINFMQKPFTLESLARKVREVLDS